VRLVPTKFLSRSPQFLSRAREEAGLGFVFSIRAVSQQVFDFTMLPYFRISYTFP
jgi:hypothetical protein